jgi:hypothetical protein
MKLRRVEGLGEMRAGGVAGGAASRAWSCSPQSRRNPNSTPALMDRNTRKLGKNRETHGRHIAGLFDTKDTKDTKDSKDTKARAIQIKDTKDVKGRVGYARLSFGRFSLKHSRTRVSDLKP